MHPLIDTAGEHIPIELHPATPIYVLATAGLQYSSFCDAPAYLPAPSVFIQVNSSLGLRLLSRNDQHAILNNLRHDIPKYCAFQFAHDHVLIISGQMEGSQHYS